MLLSVSVCPLATVPTPINNIEMPTPPTDDVKIGDKVGYHCIASHWFEDQDTRTNDSFEVTCPIDGIFPAIVWPNCVPDISCPIPTATDPGNTMTLTDPSVTNYGYESKAR